MEYTRYSVLSGYYALNSFDKRLFLAEVIGSIVDVRWKVFTTDISEILAVDYNTDFDRKFNDPFSKALIDVFTREEDAEGNRRKFVRNACYLLARANKQKSLFPESLSLNILNTLTGKSTNFTSLFNARSTTANYLDKYRKLHQPTPNPEDFSIMAKKSW